MSILAQLGAAVKSKLDLKLNISDYTASDVLTKLKTVAGVGSGLDADKLQGAVPDTANTPSTIVKRDASGNIIVNNVTGSLTGNAATASKLNSSKTITLTGVIGGAVAFDGSSNVTINTTLTGNGIALGTDTTGNYVAGVTPGAGITITGTAGEGWSPTIVNSAPNVTTDISVTHNANTVVVVSSDGTDGTINAATTTTAGVMSASDKVKLDGITGSGTYNLPNASATVLGGIKVGTNLSIDANGVLSANDTSVAWSELTSKPTTVSGYGITDAAKVDGSNVSGNWPINVTGSAAKLTTARTIANVAFDGTANIDIPYANLTGKPTAVSSFTNDSGYQTAAQVTTAIQAVVGAAPAALDTLAEIATQLSNDESAVSALTLTVAGKANTTDVNTALGNKVDKIAGKSLSTEDFTTAYKGKLDSLNNYTLPAASATVLGGIKINGTVQTVAANAITTTASRTYSVQVNSSGLGVVNVPWVDTDTVYTHPASGVTAGTYKSLTVDANGHVTGGSNPTTLAGYGITDAQPKLVSGNNIATINNQDITAGGNIVLMGMSGGVLTGPLTGIKETKVDMLDNNIDLQTGNVFTKTITAATVFTFSNIAASGIVNSIVLELTNGGSGIITWPAGVKWGNGTAPILTTSGVDILGFYSHDGGVTWRGMVLVKDSK